MKNNSMRLNLTVTEKKKFNIYEKIGKEIGLSGNAVKFIRKIGMVTPIHFKQIETSRHSLYAAYAACKKEETGEESTVPKAKAPTFIKTTSNDKPEFSEPNSTAVVAPVGNPPVDNTLTPAATSVASTSDNDEYIIVRGVCEACGQETNIRILKSQIK